MTRLNGPATELTTAATDALLGLLCIALIMAISKCRQAYPLKVRVWQWVFGILATASFLGAVAHGFDLSPALRNFLWQPLYLGLGVDVALFVIGAVFDWLGEKPARRLLPVAVAIGAVFYSLTLLSDGSFLVFVVYEGVAMIAALTIYMVLAVRKQMPGAAVISVSIGLNIAAAVLQSGNLQVTLIWPFDHNGIFHFVQMAGLLTLVHGLRSSMKSGDSLVP